MKRTTRSADLVNRHEARKLAKTIGCEHEAAIQQGVRDYLSGLSERLLKALMEGEIEELCGPRYKHDENRKFTRHGYQQGSVTVLDGGRNPIERPRARDVRTGEEAVLDTYAAFSDRKVLDERTMIMIDAGVSGRQFQKTIKTRLRKIGVSSSSVSRRVIRTAQQSLETFESRQWAKTKFVALLFDGVRVGSVMVVACIGVDMAGKKHVLGTHPGATENERVCRDLIRKLVQRGLNPDGHYLFVVDGSKALKAAIVETFGQEAVIQRCQEHKIRDVEAYVPFKLRNKVRTQMQAAYNTRSYSEASERLQKLRFQLGVYEQARNSLTEGLEASLTLHKLGIWGGLKDSLRTTNIIESTFASLRRKTRNVTCWKDEPQINRSMAHGLLQIEHGFRRVPGHRTLTRLRKALDTIYSASQSRKA